MRGRSLAVSFLAALTLLQLWLFGPSVRFFFQGDSLYWLYHRYRSWSDFGSAFLELDSYGWYRPLAHTSIPSLLYPVFGLEPLGYHLVVLTVFLATTWIVFRFLQEFSEERLSAVAATLYFGVHTSHVFVTFDHAFEPELLLGLFYICSALFFLRWLRGSNPGHYLLSVIFLALGLLAKEAALSLPFSLFLIGIFKRESGPEGGDWRTRFFPVVRDLWAHWLVLVFYVFWCFVIVRRGLSGGVLPGGGYRVEFGMNWISNLTEALLRGLNLLPLETGRSAFLHILVPGLLSIALVVAVLGMVVDRYDGGRNALFGSLWFLAALLPALSLSEFKPYYLYVPLMGGSLVFGTAASWICVRRLQLSGKGLPGALIFLLALVLCNWEAIDWQRRHHALLGPSASISRQAVADLAVLGPRIRKLKTIFLVDSPGDKLWWHYAGGSLFKMYVQEPLEVLFASAGATAPKEQLLDGSAVALRYREGRLVDATKDLLEHPEQFRDSEEVVFRAGETLDLEIEPSVISRGEGSYTLRLRDFAGRSVAFRLSKDEGPETYFTTSLDHRGESRFFVSASTAPGLYRFVGIRPEGQKEWIRVEPVTLRVR